MQLAEETNVPNFAPMVLDLDQDERESPTRLKAINEVVEGRANTKNQAKKQDAPAPKLRAKPLKNEDPTTRIYMVEYPVSLKYRSTISY